MPAIPRRSTSVMFATLQQLENRPAYSCSCRCSLVAAASETLALAPPVPLPDLYTDLYPPCTPGNTTTVHVTIMGRKVEHKYGQEGVLRLARPIGEAICCSGCDEGLAVASSWTTLPAL
eukprot:1179305-Prorocentrum_minimum.AAC.3